MRSSLIGVAMLGALACSTTSAPAPLPSIGSLDKPPAEAIARMIEREERLRFHLADGAPAVETTARELRQVLKDRGQPWRRFSVGYDRTFTTVHDAWQRIKKPDGTEKATAMADAVDAPAFPGFVLYADTRVLVFDPPPVPQGSLVEGFSRATRTSADLFLDAFSFGGDIPTASARFVLEVPAGWELEVIREQRGERSVPKVGEHYTVEKLADGERWTFERKNLAALEDESRDPGIGWSLETVFVRVRAWTDAAGVRHEAATDARALSAWVAERSKDRHQPTASLEATAREVLKGIPEGEERRRAARLYGWVRDNIRYCAIEVGMGGWIPHAADTALELRYGDCKDKANLLKALLAIAKIDSRTVQIHAADWPRPFRMPVLSGNFNHEILVVDLKDGPVFVDPTSRTTPFGDLPAVDEDRVALPNAVPGSDLVETPRSDAERNREIETLRLTLGDDGRARGTFESVMHGEAADRARHALLALPAKRHAAYYEFELAAMGPRISNLVVEGVAPPDEVAPVQARGDLVMPVARSGARDGLLLRARALIGGRLPVPVEKPEKRTRPFLLGERRSRRDEVVVTLPPHLRASRLPDDVAVDTSVARYALTWRASDDGHVLTLTREIVVKERVVSVADYKELRKVTGAASDAEAAPIAIVPAEGK